MQIHKIIPLLQEGCDNINQVYARMCGWVAMTHAYCGPVDTTIRTLHWLVCSAHAGLLFHEGWYHYVTVVPAPGNLEESQLPSYGVALAFLLLLFPLA